MRYTFICQPITLDGKTVAHEVLVRGLSDRDLLLPAQIVLDLAETNEDWMRQVDMDALDTAIISSQDKHPHHVNLSAASIGHPDYLSRLGEYLLAGKDPSLIVIEISESIEPTLDRREWLSYITSMGFELVLDDFGRCHSNNYSLALYRPSGIKIDGEITKFVTDDFYSGIIRKDLLFCKERVMSCVAECVENPKIFKALKLLSDRAEFPELRFQGWHLGVGELCIKEGKTFTLG